MRLYNDLASWWHVMSDPADYANEAALYTRVLRELAEREVREVLELGSGGGNNASHLKRHFEMTLVDPSPGMQALSRELNPECEHVEGDMRTVRLGRTFDAVFVHDAVMYMLTEQDLAAAMRTARDHLRPGGVAVFVPDETLETFQPRTNHGGHDRGTRSLRYLEWTHEIAPSEHTSLVSFVYLLREDGGPVRVEYDEHVVGVFERQTWLRLLQVAGLQAGALLHAYGEPDTGGHTELFWGLAPAD